MEGLERVGQHYSPGPQPVSIQHIMPDWVQCSFEYNIVINLNFAIFQSSASLNAKFIFEYDRKRYIQSYTNKYKLQKFFEK